MFRSLSSTPAMPRTFIRSEYGCFPTYTYRHFFSSRSSETNYTLMIFSVIFLAVYVVVLVICRKADVSIQKTTGSFLLPENNPSDRFLYAVTIDTGLRSRTRMTAKVLIIVTGYENESEIRMRDHRCMNFWIFVEYWQVHIVLYGDKGVSQTRELSSSDSKLFTCNSRNTFILRYSECSFHTFIIFDTHNVS